MNEERDPYEERYRQAARQKMAVMLIIVLGILTIAFLNAGKSGGSAMSWKDGMFRLDLPDGSSYAAPLARIEDLQLVEMPELGGCVSGAEGKKLSYGVWDAPEIGTYVLYAYQCRDPVIQFRAEGTVYRIGYESPDTTRLLYENICREVQAARESEGA